MDIFIQKTGIYQTNTYILLDNGEAIIIDPAAEAQRLCGFVAEKNCRVKHILLTHGHFDHIGAVAYLQQRGAKVYISKQDYELLDSLDFVWPIIGNDAETPVQRFSADVLIDGDTEFELIGHKFSALFTPGHTPGGLCFIVDNDTLFSGDTLFYSGVGRTDFPYSDEQQLYRSIKKLFALPKDYIVMPGHGRYTTLDFERQNNPYAVS